MFSKFCFEDTVFTSLISTVLITILVKDFTGMFVNLGWYFFWKLFPLMYKEQRHKHIKKNITC